MRVQLLMTSTVPDILARIVDLKRKEVAAGSLLSLNALEETASRRTPRDFHGALTTSAPAIIAEIKKASPSKGVLSANFDPTASARDYQRGGAAALSVLTDQPFFQGSLDHLRAAREACAIPVLRKDFTIHRAQIAEAGAAGADAILLIAAILSDSELRDFREYAESLQLAALVEVHDEEELDRAIGSGARILGVNNRDLHTFEVHLETSLRLAAKIPADAVRVSESGIHTAGDIARLRAAGYQAFLVGEHLMKSGDPARALQELRQ